MRSAIAHSFPAVGITSLSGVYQLTGPHSVSVDSQFASLGGFPISSKHRMHRNQTDSLCKPYDHFRRCNSNLPQRSHAIVFSVQQSSDAPSTRSSTPLSFVFSAFRGNVNVTQNKNLAQEPPGDRIPRQGGNCSHPERFSLYPGVPRPTGVNRGGRLTPHLLLSWIA